MTHMYHIGMKLKLNPKTYVDKLFTITGMSLGDGRGIAVQCEGKETSFWIQPHEIHMIA